MVNNFHILFNSCLLYNYQRFQHLLQKKSYIVSIWVDCLGFFMVDYISKPMVPRGIYPNRRDFLDGGIFTGCFSISISILQHYSVY